MYPLSNAVVHHFNLFSLHVSVERHECFVCQIILRKIYRGFDMSTDRLGEFQIECCWTQFPPEQTKNDTINFVMYNPSMKKERVWNYRHLLRLRLWPKDVFGHHFMFILAPGTFEGDLPERRNANDYLCNDNPYTRALARTWYMDCKTNGDAKHHECNKQHEGFLPTRLLDVQHAIATSQLRVICPEDQPSRFANTQYATLSHCWGAWGASMNPVLCVSNLKQRQEAGLEYSSVPQTFQDAVAVAHWFHSKYLIRILYVVC